MTKNIEHKAREEAIARYPDEIAKTLGGVRHGFIEGALWAEKQFRARRGGDNAGMPTVSDRIN